MLRANPANALGPDILDANLGFVTHAAAGGVTSGLAPIFCPIDPQGLPNFALSAMRMRVRTVLAASTVGMAVYAITYTAANTLTATLVAQTADASGAGVGVISADVASGPVALDFTTTRYAAAVMTSSAATLALAGMNTTSAGALGALKWNSAARTTTQDWPASFTQANVIAVAAGVYVPWAALLTAYGKWLS